MPDWITYVVALAVAGSALALRAWLIAARAALEQAHPVATDRPGNGPQGGMAAAVAIVQRPGLFGTLVALGYGLVPAVALPVTALALGREGEPLWWPHLPALGVLIVAAELVPEAWGRLRGEEAAYRLAPRLRAVLEALRPLAAPWAAVCSAGAPGGCGAGGVARPVTPADIQATADLGEEGGEVEPEVGRMLDEVMEMGTTRVRAVMTPRVEIVGLEASACTEEILGVAIESGFSRLPVYEEDLDHVEGILHVTDLLGHLLSSDQPLRAADLARPALLTPENRPLSEMLREMREQAVHLALVVDESGGTEGLVTIEDILEELVGEIADEHDLPTEGVLWTGPDEMVVEGRLRLEELAEALGVELPETEAETVTGLLTAELGRFPAEGETLTHGPLHLLVEESDPAHLSRVRVTLAEEED